MENRLGSSRTLQPVFLFARADLWAETYLDGTSILLILAKNNLPVTEGTVRNTPDYKGFTTSISGLSTL